MLASITYCGNLLVYYFLFFSRSVTEPNQPNDQQTGLKEVEEVGGKKIKIAGIFFLSRINIMLFDGQQAHSLNHTPRTFKNTTATQCTHTHTQLFQINLFQRWNNQWIQQSSYKIAQYWSRAGYTLYLFCISMFCSASHK